MKKLIGLGAAALAVPAAVAAIALFSPATADSAPGGPSLNVVGEPYYKAVTILKSQGATATFGGSFGSDLPQSQCIVSQQRVTEQGRMILNLDCTKAAADHATDSTPAGAGGSGGPNVGANGVTTVTPTPVGPQPGM